MSTDRNPLETYLKAELQRRIDDMLSYGEEMDSASWGYEEGVLLTGNEAIAILAELSRKDAEIEALRNPWISVKDRLPNKGTRRIAYLYNPKWAPFRDGHEPHRASSCTADNLIYDVLTRKDGTEPFASHWCELPTALKP